MGMFLAHLEDDEGWHKHPAYSILVVGSVEAAALTGNPGEEEQMFVGFILGIEKTGTWLSLSGTPFLAVPVFC